MLKVRWQPLSANTRDSTLSAFNTEREIAAGSLSVAINERGVAGLGKRFESVEKLTAGKSECLGDGAP